MKPEDFVQILIMLVPVLVGLAGMPLIQWLKKTLNVEDRQALALAGAVSIGLALLQQWLAGSLSVASFTPENFFFTFTTTYGSSMFFYSLIVKSTKPPEIPDYDPNQFPVE